MRAVSSRRAASPRTSKRRFLYTPYEDAKAQVVVAGGGGAGLVAALVAAQQGKHVIILEKNGVCGGDTLVCGAIYNTPDEDMQSKVEMGEARRGTIESTLELTSDDPDTQKALEEMQAPVKEQWAEYKASGRTDLFDSKEWYALQTWINGDMVADPELVKVPTYRAYDGLEWLEDGGLEFTERIGQVAGSLWERTHTMSMPMGTGLISAYYNQIEGLSDLIEVRTEATVTHLVTDGDAVVGVEAVDNHSGETFTVKASDGVVLATGGFAANGTMVEEHNTTGKWPDLSEKTTSNRETCSQGDGIVMAKEIGSDFTDMDQIQLLYMGNVQNGQVSKAGPRSAAGTDKIIFVNKNGERFVQEDGRRDQICLGVLDQPDQMYYFLESGDGDAFTFDYLVDNEYVMWDDTLEGIADKTGCDVETLQATVDAFNACVEAGEDPEFGRVVFSTTLENGPRVVTPRQAVIHHTVGGVHIDTQAHVLNADGMPIPGLMAAGEVTGGIHGGNRLGGNAVVDTVVFGELAAETLVSEA